MRKYTPIIGNNYCLAMSPYTRWLINIKTNVKFLKFWDALWRKNLASVESSLSKTMRPSPIFFVPGGQILRPRDPWESVVTAPSLNAFKDLLNKFGKTIPLHVHHGKKLRSCQTVDQGWQNIDRPGIPMWEIPGWEIPSKLAKLGNT